MSKIGDRVSIKRGIFIGNEGTIENTFKYKGIDTYVVSIFRGKNITEKFVTTVSDNDFEIV